MIVCKTIYEFIDCYVNRNKYFLELTFEDEKHLSYKVFNETLIKTLKEKGYNEEIIEVVIKLLKSYSFHYNEFIQNYIG